MSQVFNPKSGRNEDFRSGNYSDDPNQNPKSGGGSDYSFEAPGFEGYDTMNPPSISRIRGLSDTRSTSPQSNLNPSTSGAIGSVPKGTTAGSSIGSAALSAGAKYGLNKLGGLISARNSANDNATIFDGSVPSNFNPKDGMVGIGKLTETPPVTGTPLEGNGQRFEGAPADSAPTDGGVSKLNEGSDASAATNTGGGSDGVSATPSTGSAPDLSENGGYGDGGNYGDAADGASTGVSDGLGLAGTALNFAQNGINSKSIGSAAGAAIGQALIPIPIVGGIVGSAIGSAIGGRVICTELLQQGLMQKDLYEADCKYSRTNISAITLRGYHWWAIPFVRSMRRYNWLTRCVRPLAIWRAKDLAFRLGQGDRCWRGLCVRLIGEPICFVIGVFVEERDFTVLYEGRA